MVYYGNSTYYNSDFSHFGIKGMKWGVRRYQNKDGSLTSAGKKRVSNDYETYKRLKKTSVKKLTFEELDQLTKMQKNYDYIAEHRKSAGRKWIEDVLSSTGKAWAVSGLTAAGKIAARAAGTTAFTKSETPINKGQVFINSIKKETARTFVNTKSTNPISKYVGNKVIDGVDNVRNTAEKIVNNPTIKSGINNTRTTISKAAKNTHDLIGVFKEFNDIRKTKNRRR